jgi:hypothetical protein
LLRAEQPPGWWPVVAAASSSHGWVGAWAWLALRNLPPAADWTRHRGAADVTPHQRGSSRRVPVMRGAGARRLASDRAGLLPKLHAEWDSAS